MPAPPEISVVVATYNRAAVLARTLECLDRQSVAPDRFEVIVADDGSPDNTPEMIERMTSTVRFPLRYFRHKNQGPGATQNVGIREAASDLVLLIADDIQPTPTVLAEHLKSHAEYPGDEYAVLGKVIQSPALPPTALHKVWNPFQYHRFSGRHEVEGYHFMGCHISVKKNFLLANGLYRERKGAAHEDIELGYRLWKKGLRIVYNPDALAHHEHEESLEKMCTRAYERGVNFDLLTENIPAEFVYPLYKVFAPNAGLTACLRMLPRECGRAALFNGPMVNRFWLPILRSADHNKLASLLATETAYRGVSGYFMRKGIRDKHRQDAEMAERPCAT